MILFWEYKNPGDWKNECTYNYRNDIIIKNEAREPNYTEALRYFDSIASYTDELRKLQRSLRVTIGWVSLQFIDWIDEIKRVFSDYVKGNLRDAANQEALGITILIVVLAVSPVIIWLVHNAVATIQVNWTFSVINSILFSYEGVNSVKGFFDLTRTNTSSF